MLRCIMENYPFDPSGAEGDAAEPFAAPIQPAPDEGTLFMLSAVYGVGGVVAGAAAYGLIQAFSPINMGYFAIGVAWLVAKAMMMGSRGHGGRQFQVMAVVMTYLSVTVGQGLAYAIQDWRAEGPFRLSGHNAAIFLRAGLISPITDLQDNAGWGIIGLFIIFVGLRAAWRMTSGDANAMRHPFSR